MSSVPVCFTLHPRSLLSAPSSVFFPPLQLVSSQLDRQMSGNPSISWLLGSRVDPVGSGQMPPRGPPLWISAQSSCFTIDINMWGGGGFPFGTATRSDSSLISSSPARLFSITLAGGHKMLFGDAPSWRASSVWLHILHIHYQTCIDNFAISRCILDANDVSSAHTTFIAHLSILEKRLLLFLRVYIMSKILC